MRPDISEFSFGYALVEELATQHRGYLTAAPVFLSLIEEGQRGKGWDAMLQVSGVPAFLQFKVGDRMTTRAARECKHNGWAPPFYRMHLRAARYSNQHQSLLDLEAQGHLVHYVAPAFHQPVELNDAYLDRQVVSRSIWLRPSAIQVPPDGKEHHIGYVGPQGPYCVSSSEPKAFETDASFEAFVAHARASMAARRYSNLDVELTRLGDDLETALSRREPRKGTEASAAYLAESVEQIDRLVLGQSSLREVETLRRLRDVPPRARAAYLTRIFFDAELLLVGPPLEP